MNKYFDIKCRHNCKGAAVAIVYVPEGCNCFVDPIQALCMQHLEKIHSTGPITILEDFTLDKVLTNDQKDSSSNYPSLDANAL